MVNPNNWIIDKDMENLFKSIILHMNCFCPFDKFVNVNFISMQNELWSIHRFHQQYFEAIHITFWWHLFWRKNFWCHISNCSQCGGWSQCNLNLNLPKNLINNWWMLHAFNIHVEFHKTHIWSGTIPVGKHNLLPIFLVTKVLSLLSIFMNI